MEGNTYLVPANAKKSTLILGFFTPLDLIIFGIGVAFTLVMLLVIQSTSFKTLVLIVLPALASATLVLPVPYYHNVLQLLINIFNFFFSQRKYRWKGWCILDDEQK